MGEVADTIWKLLLLIFALSDVAGFGLALGRDIYNSTIGRWR